MNEFNRRDEARRRLRKGIFIIPSLFTIGNIFCGFYSIMQTMRGFQVINDPGQSPERFFDNAARSIGFAFLFDMLDGRIARMTGATSAFGIEFDSLADVLSFGVAPAMLAFAWGYGLTPGLTEVGWIVSFTYLICGALRLARFNVHAHNPPPTDVSPTKLDKKQFVGMPIPAGATLIASIVHFTPVPVIHDAKDFTAFGIEVPVGSYAYGVFLLLLLLALSLLMISTIRHTSFKGIGPHTRKPVITVLFIALILASIWFYSQWTLLLMASVYALHGVAFKLWGMIRRKHRAETPVKLGEQSTR